MHAIVDAVSMYRFIFFLVNSDVNLTKRIPSLSYLYNAFCNSRIKLHHQTR